MTYKIKNKKVDTGFGKPVWSIEDYKKSKPVNINAHNFSWEEENGKVKVSLGNMSDAGWYWNGTDKEFIGFLHRLENSQVKDEFLEETKGINFDKKVKPYLHKSAKTKDGLYEMSGDNVRWHFGQDLMDSYDLKEEEGLTEEQEKEFWVQFNGLTYEKFQRKYGKQYQQDIDKAISESHSFKEFMDKTNKLKEEYNEYADEETMNEVRETINKIGKK